MAVHFSAKPANGTQFYEWAPDLREGDAISSYTLTPTGCTIEADETDNETISLYISGGTAGATSSIAASVETTEGESLKETIYLPIIDSAANFAETAADVIEFALRPIVGLSGTAETEETADALEWLNGMLASWREVGADIGVALPLTTSSNMVCRDAHLLAVKNALRVLVAEQYGRQVAPMTAMMAARGLQQIKNFNIENASGASYF